MVATAHITAATQINTYICQVVPISTLSSTWFLGLTQVFPPPKRRLDLFGHFCRVCRDTYSHSMRLCLSLAKGCVCLCMRAVLNMSYFLFMLLALVKFCISCGYTDRKLWTMTSTLQVRWPIECHCSMHTRRRC